MQSQRINLSRSFIQQKFEIKIINLNLYGYLLIQDFYQ